MKVLVTGGAGYIGSVVCEQLLKRGDDVCVLDDFSMGHRGAIEGVENVAEMSTTNAELCRYVFTSLRPDAVIHLAALVAVEDSLAVPFPYYDVNAVATVNILKAMFNQGVMNLVFASSAAVYGDLPAEPVREDHHLHPCNPYGQTKAWSEAMIEAACRSLGFNATCFRFFNVAGATEAHGEDHLPETHLFPNVVQAAIYHQPVSIFGTDYDTPDGSAIRDFIHVADIARAHIMALDKLAGFKVYNLGNGAGHTCLEVVRAVEKASGVKIPVTECPRRPGDIAGMVSDSSKAARELGWVPEYSLEDMAASAWAWAQAHKGGYDE